MQDNEIESNLINIFENWLSKCSSKIVWNDVLSKPVSLLSGVRQGGILSPLLFSIFVDDILNKLKSSNLGCYINFECLNSYMYADDILLLANSVTDLQLMLNLCSNIFQELDLPINVEKSHCLRIGPRCKFTCQPLILSGASVTWSTNTKYLEMTLCNSNTFSCC